MRFLNNNKLELYWKDDQGNKRNIIKNVNTDVNPTIVTYSETIDVNASSNVSKNKYEI